MNNKEFKEQLHKEVIKMKEEYKRNKKKKEEKKIIKEWEEER